MCGIAGIINPELAGRSDIVRTMLNAIRHRGPDGDGVWEAGGTVLGHVRLSIIDLSDTGRQPMCNEDKTVWVIFNGEIYNYKELREELQSKGHVFKGASDTEVIPHLYEEYGSDFVLYLRGMFAIAIWDTVNQRLVLARDRVGKKPLFYTQLPGNGFAFCSEMKGLLRIPGSDFRIRDQGIYDFLSYGVVPGSHTVYEGIHRVPPASVLVFDVNGQCNVKRYWDVSFLPKLKISREDAIDEVKRLLTEAILLRLRSDVPVGCFLSGGIDSGLITAIASTNLNRPLKTYCIGFDDGRFDERALASLVARRFGTEHTEWVLETSQMRDELPKIIAHYDEPYAAQSALPSYAVSRLASAEIKVALNGDGGDEVFAGYRHFVAGRLIERFGLARAEKLSMMFRVISALLPVPRDGRTSYQMAYRFLDVLGQKGASRYSLLTNDRLREDEKTLLFGLGAKHTAHESSLRIIEEMENQCGALGMLDSLMLKDLKQMLPDDHLVKMDMATMAHSLEVRSPFLDCRLIEFVAALPEPYRLNGLRTKPILRELAEKLLPKEIGRGKKRGFEIPLLRWMKGELHGMLLDMVLSAHSYAMSNFDQSAVRRFLVGGGWDEKRWANIAFTLLCLEIWWTNYRNNYLR